MDIKSIALAATLLVTSAGVNAALITNLSNLDINGTNYDVTFHTGAGDSFSALWDANDDGIFGGGGSTFATEPAFWGDIGGAFGAAIAITAALGISDQTVASGSDGFLIPYDANTGSGISNSNDNIMIVYDNQYFSLPDDSVTTSQINETLINGSLPYVSFQVSPVPLPAALWLFGSGLLGLIGVARRKVRV